MSTSYDETHETAMVIWGTKAKKTFNCMGKQDHEKTNVKRRINWKSRLDFSNDCQSLNFMIIGIYSEKGIAKPYKNAGNVNLKPSEGRYESPQLKI